MFWRGSAPAGLSNPPGNAHLIWPGNRALETLSNFALSHARSCAVTCDRAPSLSPPINQSARLAAGRCSCYVRSVGCEEHDMRLMMQGLTDAAFEQRFGAEGACLAALAAARQAAGMACPRCGNPKSYVYGRRVGCTRCNQRWPVTSGTVMADTKLPLTHWFRAMHLMTSTKQGISAIETTAKTCAA